MLTYRVTDIHRVYGGYRVAGDRNQERGDGVLRVQAEADAQGSPHLHHPQVDLAEHISTTRKAPRV